MKRARILVLFLVILLAGCASSQDEPTPAPTAAPIDQHPLPNQRGDYFATSGVCATCHKNQVDGEGNDVSIDTFWRGTMMANSGRDPYWQASVRGEVISHPDYNELIQDKCSTCHLPMARTTKSFAGEDGVILDNGFLNATNELHTLGIDGISCTLCHQIEADGLGTEASYDGHYIIDETKPVGERISYGPYAVAESDVVVMRSASGYVPEKHEHIQGSELCGSCHTLYTPTVGNDGEVAGIFPEQMPYIEWLASDYVDEQSCQDCHMPEAKGEVVLSITGSPARANFSPHSFAGGNTYAIRLLQTYGEEIGVTAANEHFNAALERANSQLRNLTANVEIDSTVISGTTLDVGVRVTSKVGHKFPSGFPSRRVWLHLAVMDVDGNVVFESGGWAEDGAIFGNNNDLDETTFEPHYEIINDPNQVQIYEAIMGDVDGAVTTTLLRGAMYLKDSRLLPSGFDKPSVSEDIAVYGAAEQDADFVGGSDQVIYQIDLVGYNGPYTVTVELLYQSIAYRWAQNLARFDAPEPVTFLEYYGNVANSPVLVSSDTAEIQP